MAQTEKGKALSKWVPTGDFLSSYDRIFGKKAEDAAFIVAANAVSVEQPKPFTSEALKEAFTKEKTGIAT